MNIDSETRQLAIGGLLATPPDSACLTKAQAHVFKLMSTDSYSRWIRTLPLPKSEDDSSKLAEN